MCVEREERQFIIREVVVAGRGDFKVQRVAVVLVCGVAELAIGILVEGGVGSRGVEEK
jgi:hypothetical protein